MATNVSTDSQALADRWHRFSAAAVRAFHRYATWLVGLTWWRFTLYALLLLIMTGIVKEIPPFSWKYTETVVDSSSPRHSRHGSPKPPPLPAPAAPAPPAAPASMGAPPVAPVAPSAPQIKITKAPDTGTSGDSKTIDIDLPGIVIDTKKHGTIRKGNVNITFGENGIHITTDNPSGDAANAQAEAAAAQAADAARLEAQAVQAEADAAQLAASAARERSPEARDKALEKARAAREKAADARVRAEERAQAARERAHEMEAEARDRTREAVRAAVAEASSAAAAAAAAAVASAPFGVDVTAGGQSVHITVPPDADSSDVKEAIAEARSSIVDAIREAADQRREQVQAAKEAADEAVAAARRNAQADDEDDSGDSMVMDDGHRRVRTHTVRYGENLPLFAMWWVLGSLLVKITYKGRIQAEAKAAVATETAEAESLRRQVLEAKMAMMQAQVEPHFLFNTLASIDHLIEFDPKRASQMQRNLISLLRASMPSMRSTDSGLRPLDLELAVVRPCLEILKVRMEERLTTEIDVPDGLLSAEFPPMMIQTLVENSIKHGLEPKAEGGHLSVKAEIRHGHLCVTVADTGLGFETAAKGTTHGTGVGLSNIRERLALLYGAKASLTIANNPVGGTIVTITVPYTTHSDDEGASA